MTLANTPPTARRRGRPPKNEALAYTDTRGRLIDAGLAVLTEKGYASVGIEEILRLVGVPKGSFYYYFESKEAFGQALIAAYAEYYARKLDRYLLDLTRTPLQRFRDYVDSAREGMARFEFRRGCLIGNLGQEMNALPESFRQQLLDVFKDWEQRVARCLEEARQVGEIGLGQDPARLAAFFLDGWEGAVLRAKLERSDGPLDRFAGAFFGLLAESVK